MKPVIGSIGLRSFLPPFITSGVVLRVGSDSRNMIDFVENICRRLMKIKKAEKKANDEKSEEEFFG